jgi:hypothetical protein
MVALNATDELERVRRESRVALRRAGIAMPRERGDPVVLWAGPLRYVLPVAGGLVTVIGAGVLAAEAKMQWNVDTAISSLALALVVGLLIRFLFGGVSRVAGLTAAVVYLAGVASGQWFAGSGASAHDAAWLSTASQWVLAHTPAAVACYIVAGFLAYAAGRGRRPI